MLRALFTKKMREFRAGHVRAGLTILFLLSFLAVFPRLAAEPSISTWLEPEIAALLLIPLAVAGFFLGLGCAMCGFVGDYVREAHRFLEYLPIRRSAIWLVGYLTGASLLGLSAVLLFGTGVLLYQPPSPELAYFVPDRVALTGFTASFLFWMFSIAVFPAAFLRLDKEGATAANAGGAIGATFLLPVTVVILLRQLRIMPSATELAPVLLCSALLFTAGSYVLFTLMPRHMTRAKRAACGLGLFSVCTALVLGHLYVKHLTWREIDPWGQRQIWHVHKPHLANKPNVILADIRSYRSGEHCVSVDVGQGTYHDLGRELSFVDVPGNASNFLHFVHSPGDEYLRDGTAVVMAPDATSERTFELECCMSWSSLDSVKWLRDGKRLVYVADSREVQESHLYVADGDGTVREKFEINYYSSEFVLSPSDQILALAPWKTNADRQNDEVVVGEEKPYMIIDVDTAAVFRFDLPGAPLFFAKDLRRVICSRFRIQSGRLYESYVLVELPSLEVRTLLPEEEFPAIEVTSQLETTVNPTVSTDADAPTTFLRADDKFDTAFWVKQRVDGDYFRYSLVSIDLDTGQRTIAVPESATPSVSVVKTNEQTETAPVTLHGSTVDGTGFLFQIGQHYHLYDLAKHESILLADAGIFLDVGSQKAYAPCEPVFSPSGRHVLRFGLIWRKTGRILSLSEPMEPIAVAIEVFRNGKPKFLFRGSTISQRAFWLDEERIIFHDSQIIYVLNAADGSFSQVFPPKSTENAGVRS